MVTMAQRIEQLRGERGLSRPALSVALGFPRMAVEKFETGRQTPTQDQQEKLAAFFGVSVFYLRGENNDRTRMDDWMDGAFLDPLGGKKFQESLRGAVLEVLRSQEGQELLSKAVRRELAKGK